jgi:16S rRNA (uracil1498-N3)-methyltransferase
VYVDAPLQTGRRESLEGSAANHIARVLRLGVGDSLTLFDGRGGEYAARIDSIRKQIVCVEVQEHTARERESPSRITLAQGISRGERMEWVVQKATELGVSRIVPLFTERSVVQLDAQQARKRVAHWTAVAVGACEQSGRNRVPEIHAPLSLRAFLDSELEAVRIVLSPRGTRRMSDIEAPAAAVLVLIGPEGGLAPPEIDAAAQAHFVPVCMGPRILRTETAAICALTLLQHRFGDL